jgi:hypothetical protein
MEIPAFSSVVSDPRYTGADLDTRKKIVDKYWTDFESASGNDAAALQHAADMRSHMASVHSAEEAYATASPLERKFLDHTKDVGATMAKLQTADREKMFPSPEDRYRLYTREQSRLEANASKLASLQAVAKANAEASVSRGVYSAMAPDSGLQERAGSQQGTWEGVKSAFNSVASESDAIAEALAKNDYDFDKAKAWLAEQSQAVKPAVWLGGDMDVAAIEEATRSQKYGRDTQDTLFKIRAAMDEAGIAPEDRKVLLDDYARENAWGENDTVRTLSTGELVFNPNKLFGADVDVLRKDIEKSDATPEQKELAAYKLEAARQAASGPLTLRLREFDSGFRKYLDKQSGKPISDRPQILDDWVNTQKGRNVLFRFGDTLRSAVLQGGMGIDKTIVGTLAGLGSMVGAGESLGKLQAFMGETIEGRTQAENIRGVNEMGRDLGGTIVQMAPMAPLAAIAGIAGASLWAGAQGYEQTVADAVRIESEKFGRKLTSQEREDVMGRAPTQIAAFANGIQTAALTYLMPGGAEAAISKLGTPTTLRSFIKQGGLSVLKNEGFKKTVKELAKTTGAGFTYEAIEEGLNQAFQRAISVGVLGDEVGLGDFFEEIGYASFLGGLSGGALVQFQGMKDAPLKDAADLIRQSAPITPEAANSAMVDLTEAALAMGESNVAAAPVSETSPVPITHTPGPLAPSYVVTYTDTVNGQPVEHTATFGSQQSADEYAAMKNGTVTPPAAPTAEPVVIARKNLADVDLPNLDEVVANGGGQLKVTHQGTDVPFDNFIVTIDGNEASVYRVEVSDKSEASKGIGTLAYIQLGNRLAERGIVLGSDPSQEAGGRNLWLRLVREGYAVRKGNGYVFTPKVSESVTTPAGAAAPPVVTASPDVTTPTPAKAKVDADILAMVTPAEAQAMGLADHLAGAALTPAVPVGGLLAARHDPVTLGGRTDFIFNSRAAAEAFMATLPRGVAHGVNDIGRLSWVNVKNDANGIAFLRDRLGITPQTDARQAQAPEAAPPSESVTPTPAATKPPTPQANERQTNAQTAQAERPGLQVTEPAAGAPAPAAPTPQPNVSENQIPEAGGAAPLKEQPAQPSPAVQAGEGTPQREGQGAEGEVTPAPEQKTPAILQKGLTEGAGVGESGVSTPTEAASPTPATPQPAPATVATGEGTATAPAPEPPATPQNGRVTFINAMGQKSRWVKIDGGWYKSDTSWKQKTKKPLGPMALRDALDRQLAKQQPTTPAAPDVQDAQRPTGTQVPEATAPPQAPGAPETGGGERGAGGGLGTGAAAVVRDPQDDAQKTPDEFAGKGDSSYPGARARALAKDKKALVSRLREALSFSDVKDRSDWKPDLAKLQLVSPDGKKAIRYKIRKNPSEPTSYENQQTAVGTYDFVDPNSPLKGNELGTKPDTQERHESRITWAVEQQLPVSAAAVDAYSIQLPEGYVRQGDLYVYQPSPPPTEAEPTESLPAGPPTPGGGGTPPAEAPLPSPVHRDYSPEAIQEAFNLTEEQAAAVDTLVRSMGLDTTKIRIAKGGTPGDLAFFQYAGENAELPVFRKDSLQTARDMAAAGRPSEEIRAVTGWFPGVDGKLRWEIPDNGAALLPEFALAGDPGVNLTLGDVLRHLALFAAYPKAAWVRIVRQTPLFDPDKGAVQGWFDALNNTINIAPEATDPLSTALHEIQHWIQEKEGFARGGNLEAALDAVPEEKLRKEVNKLGNRMLAKQDDLMDEIKKQRALRAKFTAVNGTKLDEAIRNLDGIRANLPGLDQVGRTEALARYSLAEQELATVLGMASPTEDYETFFEAKAAPTREALLKRIDTRIARNKSALVAVNDDIFVLTKGDRGEIANLLRKHNIAFEFYRAVAGEVEARDVQERRDYTPEQRAAIAPYASQNIAPEDMIVIDGGTGVAPSITPQQDAAYLAAVERGDIPADAPVYGPEQRQELSRRYGLASSVDGPSGRVLAYWDEANDQTAAVVVMPKSDKPKPSPVSEAEMNDRRYMALVESLNFGNPVLPDLQRMVDEAAKAAGAVKTYRYVSRDGVGMLNRDAYNEDKLNDDDAQELDEWLNYGLQQPRDVANDQVFLFTEEGDLQHAEGLRLLKKAARRGFVKQTQYVVGNPSWESGDGQLAVSSTQIKSADPVTRDASGNVIPLSQRFNPQSPSILYQGNLDGAKASMELLANGDRLVRALANPDVSSALHEMAHIARQTVLTPEEQAVAAEWAGAKDGVWDTKAEEKFARGFERYMYDGMAPTERLKNIFAKISEWMKQIYQSLQGSDIDIEISPAMRRVFDALVSRVDLTAPMVMSDGSPAPVPVSPTPDAIDAAESEPDPAKKKEMEAALVVGAVEEGVAPPDTGVIDYETAGLPDENLFSGQMKFTQAERARLGYPPESALAGDLGVSQHRFKVLQRKALAAEENWKKLDAPPAKNAASALIGSRIATQDFTTPLTDEEIVLIDNEGLRRRMRQDAVLKRLADLTDEEANAPVGEVDGVTLTRGGQLEAELAEADREYTEIMDFTRNLRAASGRSLNAWKAAVKEDYSIAALILRRKTDINKVLRAQGDKGITEIPEDERNQLVKLAAQLQEKFEQKLAEGLAKQKAQQDLDLLAAQARAAEAEATTAEEKAKAQTLREALDAVTGDLDTLAKSIEGQRKESVTSIFKRKAIERGEAALSRLRARHPASKILNPNRMMSFSDFSAEDVKDAAILVASWLAQGTLTLSDVTVKLVGVLGDAIYDLAPKIFAEAMRSHTRNLMESNGIDSPDQVLDTIDPDDGPSRRDIYDLVRAHVAQGLRGFAVIDAVTADLQQVFPEVTREDVVIAFVNYGATKPKPDDITEQVSMTRRLEKVNEDIRRMKLGMKALKTNAEVGEPDSPQRIADREAMERELRKLRRERINVSKDLGIKLIDEDRQLATAQSAARRRMLNEIEDLDTALNPPDGGPPTPIVRTRSGVEYVGDMNEIRARLMRLREDYAKAFPKDKKLAAEEQARRMLAALDRQIEAEQRLIDAGLLKAVREGKPGDTPEIAARRKLLEEKRELKRRLYEAAHPGETALLQAYTSAFGKLNRRVEMLRTGNVRPDRQDGVTPQEEGLLAILDEVESLDDLIKEARKATPLTPEQERKKLKALISSAEAARDKLREKVTKGDLTVKQKVESPLAKNIRVQAARKEARELNALLVNMRRDARVGSFSEEARIARAIGTKKKVIAELKRRIEQKDYREKAKIEPVTSPEITQLDVEIEDLKFKLEQDSAEAMFKRMSKGAKAWANIKSAAQLRTIVSLSGDLGVPARQLGFATFGTFPLRDMIKLTKAAFNIGDAREDIRNNGLILTRLFGAMARAAVDPQFETEVFLKMRHDPVYNRRKKHASLVSPKETTMEIGDTGSVQRNPMDLVPTWAWVVAGGTKAAVKSFAKGEGFDTPIKLAADIAGGAALGGIARPSIKVIERMGRVALNVGRWEYMNILDDTRLFEKLGLEKGPDFYDQMAKFGMIATGKATGGPTFERVMKALGPFAAFPRWIISQWQLVTLTPIAQVGLGIRKPNRMAMAKISEQYAIMVASTAMWSTLIGMAIGFIVKKDDEDDEEYDGVFWNPWHKHFGEIRYKGVVIQVMSGRLKPLGMLAKMIPTEWAGYGWVDEDKSTIDETVYRPASAYDRGNLLGSYLSNRIAPPLDFLYRLAVLRQFREGGSLESMSWMQFSDRFMQEAVSNMLVSDAVKLAEKYHPATAAAVITMATTGQNVLVVETDQERKDRLEKERQRTQDYYRQKAAEAQ